MSKKKVKLQFRYYDLKQGNYAQALLGEKWYREYGEGLYLQHFHRYLEIGVYHDGGGNCVLNNRAYDITPHSFSVVPPNCPHTNNSGAGQKKNWEWIYIDTELVLKRMAENSGGKMDERLMLIEIYKYAAFFSVHTNPKLANIIYEVLRELRQKRYMYQEKVYGLLCEFFVEILRNSSRKININRTGHLIAQIVPALQYLQEGYKEYDLSVSGLAEVCSVSESYFRRIFQECMGMSPHEYITLVRTQEACKLLLNTRFNMEEVACRVGYSNVSTFNRSFKRAVGTSPYQWKKAPFVQEHALPSTPVH